MMVMLLFGCHLNKSTDLIEFVLREAAAPFGAIPRYRWVPVLPTLAVLGIAASFLLGVVFLLGLSDSVLGLALGSYQLYGVLLTLELVHMLCISTVSGAVGSWYWSTAADLKVCPAGECWSSFRRAFSLSTLGSVIRASFSFAGIRPVLEVLHAARSAVDPEQANPGCQVCVHTCCCCCLAPAECLKTVDEKACIQV
eukprot:TRINITY_DN11600_c0_g1_i13.p2 TRINITY_DN11600_c0_g1~~TRINITY_DN11600_c0_g1_i13.p2  ORF type:complete len:197 (+),score=56.91 TRINITY_DN11600_c0_g1_i13:1132-1722(+)